MDMCQARSVAKAQGAGTVEMDLLEVVHGMLGLLSLLGLLGLLGLLSLLCLLGLLCLLSLL